jgi:hypothetical protein
MIIALIGALLFLFGGGGSLEFALLNIKEPVKAAVANGETADAVLDLSSQLGKELKELNKQLSDLQPKLHDLLTAYDCTGAELSDTLEGIREIQKSAQAEILNTRFGMKELLTEEEWTDVFTPAAR